MINIKTLTPGNLLMFKKDYEFHNDGFPNEFEKGFVPWTGLNNKIYNSLPLNGKGLFYSVKQGDSILFLDYLERIFTKSTFDYYQKHVIYHYQIGVLLLHKKNNIFLNLNTIRNDVFQELPKDMQSCFYKTFLFTENK